jgi:hypothetical protein
MQIALPLIGEGHDRYLRDFFRTTLETRGGVFDARVVDLLAVLGAVLEFFFAAAFPFAFTGLTSVRICSCIYNWT